MNATTIEPVLIELSPSKPNCPDYNDEGEEILAELSFWMEGILQTSVAVCGLICNIVSTIVLADREMQNSFNLLLIALSIFDIGYLLGSILESFRKSFNLVSALHTNLFPCFLYPGQMIMMTASIFMTVAIAMERYAAVHYPLDYNQSMNDARASLRRVTKYVVPVVVFAILFNIPKFFESEVLQVTDQYGNMHLELGVTKLRKDPLYSTYYSSWARSAVTGIIPFCLLVWFNMKIYQDIQFRRRRRCPRKTSAEAKEEPSGHRQNSHLMLNKTTDCAINMHIPPKQSLTNNARRTMEDNLAVIFMGIVGVFLLCHMPRILLSIHEMWTVNETLRCAELGKKVFPLWALIFSQFSHLLLVINSSVNSLIYCMISSRFRKAALDKAKKWGCIKNERATPDLLETAAGSPNNKPQKRPHLQDFTELPLHQVEMLEMVPVAGKPQDGAASSPEAQDVVIKREDLISMKHQSSVVRKVTKV